MIVENYLRFRKFTQSDSADGPEEIVQPAQIQPSRFLHVHVYGASPTSNLMARGRRSGAAAEFDLGPAKPTSEGYRFSIVHYSLLSSTSYLFRVADNFESPLCLVSHSIQTVDGVTTNSDVQKLTHRVEVLEATVETIHQRLQRSSDDLHLGEHIPISSEAATVGAATNKIRRGTPEFLALVENNNPDISFKDEEGTGADRIMTRRLKTRLDVLAGFVKAEWPGTILRVTEAWDEDDEHGANSVHYEGRAADLTTWPIDNSKLGRLGRLAVRAGFDWVFYENAAHIHVSLR